MITLDDKQIKELEAFIQEMPTKFGVPLLNFLTKIAQEQNQEQPVVEVTE